MSVPRAPRAPSPPSHPRARPRIARALALALLPAAHRANIERLHFHDAGHGYDVFGMHPDWVAAGLGLFRFLYEHYFRVDAHGHEHLPAQGPAIFAANHSGTVPFDAAMIYLDIARHTNPMRVVRPIGNRFIPLMPVASTVLARIGATPGTRENLRYLLETGELVLIFPEGTPGVGKPFSQRYHLQEWRVGHAETAIAHGVPIIPTAVIGAEEQWPQVARIPVKFLGAPYLPLPATPFPLPVHYHLYYGAPIHFSAPPEDATRPEVVRAAAEQVKVAVEALVARGLRERKGVFR